MTKPEKQPDGMVHYHPKYGWYWPKLNSDNLTNLKSYGYQLKPVWLSTEPPVSREVLEDLLTAIEDFKCARTCHHNAAPEERSDTMTVYNDIIRRLEAILPEETKGE